VIRRQFPAGAVIGVFEIMGDPQMSAKRLRTIPALEANHTVLLHRSPDRHRRFAGLLHWWPATPEIGERLMHLDDQPYELVGPNLVMPHVATDDVRDLIEIDPWRRILFGHLRAP
jgi:hypothetical protein